MGTGSHPGWHSRNTVCTIGVLQFWRLEKMSTNLKEKAQPQRLHHNARVVKDHERTRHFYEDIVGMPLLATWAEVGQFRSSQKDQSAIVTRFMVWRTEARSHSLGLPSLTSMRLSRQRFNPHLTISPSPYLRSYRLRSSKISKRQDIRQPSSIMVTVSRYM